MPLLRLQYNGDNQYTTKDKRMLLLTQQAIDKINNISTEGIDAVVETRTHTPYQTMTFAQLAALNDVELILEELNKAPIDYLNSLIDEGVMRRHFWEEPFISEDGEYPWFINDFMFSYYSWVWTVDKMS